jgi:uncharacterized membrane protein
MDLVMKPTRILAIILMVLGAAMIILSLTLADIGGGGTNNNAQTGYTLSNVFFMGAGGFLLATGLMMFFLWDEYHKLNEVRSPSSAVADVEKEKEVKVGTETPTRPTEEDYLVLRLLSGDERTMFRAIIDNGGEALQKDMIVKLKWSDAKVSRVIDRLIEKEVATKERHGSTNKVRAIIER